MPEIDKKRFAKPSPVALATARALGLLQARLNHKLDPGSIDERKPSRTSLEKDATPAVSLPTSRGNLRARPFPGHRFSIDRPAFKKN
jgi:hypothetical protein